MIEHFDIPSYGDDNTSCVSANNVNGVVKSFEKVAAKLFKWFSDNLIKSIVLLSRARNYVHVNQSKNL